MKNQKVENIDFTYRECVTLDNMFKDITKERPLNNKSPFVPSKEDNDMSVKYYQGEGGRLFLKLAYLNLPNTKAHTFSIPLDSMQQRSGKGGIGALLFNFYANDDLKSDYNFAYDLLKIDGRNFLYYDLADKIKQDYNMERYAFYHDKSLNKEVFVSGSKKLQSDTNGAFIWLRDLYKSYNNNGIDGYQELMECVFNDSKNSAIRIKDRDVVTMWINNKKFMEDMTKLDSRFQNLENKKQMLPAVTFVKKRG